MLRSLNQPLRVCASSFRDHHFSAERQMLAIAPWIAGRPPGHVSDQP
jgi:hypothetical protein